MIFHGVRAEHFARYLKEMEFRHNHRNEDNRFGIFTDYPTYTV